MQTETLSSTFGALADPTRRAILGRLVLGEVSVKELAAPFAMSQPAISKHLKVLEAAGLISRGREAQSRPARLEVAALQGAAAWMEQYRRHWEESFDRLDGVLRELQAGAAVDDSVRATKVKGKSKLQKLEKKKLRKEKKHGGKRR